jgi:transposase
VVSEAARRADVVPGQIYRWRKELRVVADGFAAVLLAPPDAEPATAGRDGVCGEPAIEVEFAGKAGSDTELDAVGLAAAVVKALSRR